MTIGQAREEVEQYLTRQKFECPLGRYTWEQNKVEELQYCLFDSDMYGHTMSDYHYPAIYAAQVNWNASVVASLRKPPKKWSVPRPTPYRISHEDIYALLKTDGKAYKQFIKACDKGVPNVRS